MSVAGALRILVVIAMALPPAHSMPAEVGLPAALRGGEWRLQGRGELSWLGLEVYQASLWVRGDRWTESGVFALEIRYHRAFSAQQLVSTSVDEMRRQGHDERRLVRWRDALAAVLPPVDAGDTLLGVHLPDIGLQLWHRGRLVAEVGDAELVRAFFAIWLGPASRAKTLRAQLLGTGEGG